MGVLLFGFAAGFKNQKVHFLWYEVHIVQKAVYIWKRFEYNKNISRTLR